MDLERITVCRWPSSSTPKRLEENDNEVSISVSNLPSFKKHSAGQFPILSNDPTTGEQVTLFQTHQSLLQRYHGTHFKQVMIRNSQVGFPCSSCKYITTVRGLKYSITISEYFTAMILNRIRGIMYLVAITRFLKPSLHFLPSPSPSTHHLPIKK